jgi:hypothetical protein
VIAWMLFSLETRAALAQGVETVRVVYAADRACPGRDGFVRELEARSRRVRAASAGESARTFYVELISDPSGHGATGSLTIEERGRPAAHRVLRGADCTEAARALSFIAALAVDPAASPPPDSEAEERERAPRRAPPLAVRAGRGGATNAPRSLQSAPRAVWSAGAGAEAWGLAVPSAAAGLRAFWDVRFARAQPFSPSVRLSIARTLESTVEVESSRSAFTWTLSRIELCPVRWGSTVALGACAALDAGIVHARAAWADQHAGRSRPWLAAGLGLRGSWRFLPWLGVEAEAGLVVPWIREDFVYRPSPNAYRAPQVVPFGGLSMVIFVTREN